MSPTASGSRREQFAKVALGADKHQDIVGRLVFAHHLQLFYEEQSMDRA
jgi:hypothetical protein